MKILQINTTVNTGSTGRITEDIGKLFISNGHESYIAFGRGDNFSNSVNIKIGSQIDVIKHGVQTLLFDKHGFGSKEPTKKLIKEIEKIGPDVIGLHNLHGYYINIEILFEYILKKKIPVIWTLFDCWAFTGHCSYFDDINCERWRTGCFSCPKKSRYPRSIFLDNSFDNYSIKKDIFNSVPNLSIIVHSDWLANLVKESFLKDYPVSVIRSGVDLEVFKPTGSNVREKYNIHQQFIILGCANIWDRRKGLTDFILLSESLKSDEVIVLVGIDKKKILTLPPGIIGIERTESINELAALYSAADVFVNPTWQDNFPTTNIEALACGTPVITYNTGGSPEALSNNTGFVVDKGDINGLISAIQLIKSNSKKYYLDACLTRAKEFFDKKNQYIKYLQLYQQLLNQKL